MSEFHIDALHKSLLCNLLRIQPERLFTKKLLLRSGTLLRLGICNHEQECKSKVVQKRISKSVATIFIFVRATKMNIVGTGSNLESFKEEERCAAPYVGATTE